MLSSEFCKIFKNIFFNRTPLVIALLDSFWVTIKFTMWEIAWINESLIMKIIIQFVVFIMATNVIWSPMWQNDGVFCSLLFSFSYMLKFNFKNSTPKPILLLPQPAWDISERSQSNLHWERHMRDLLEITQKRLLFCDVFEMSQIHLKKMSFCDVFKTSRKDLKNMSFIRRL